MFNKHYINIVAKASGIAPKTLGNPLDPKDENNIREIIENYRNHPSKLYRKNPFSTFLRPPHKI